MDQPASRNDLDSSRDAQRHRPSSIARKTGIPRPPAVSVPQLTTTARKGAARTGSRPVTATGLTRVVPAKSVAPVLPAGHTASKSSTARKVSALDRDVPIAPQQPPLRADSSSKTSARKQVALAAPGPNISRGLPHSSLQPAAQRPTKSVALPPWFDRKDEVPPTFSGGRRRRDESDLGGPRAPRMVVSAMSSRRTHRASPLGRPVVASTPRSDWVVGPGLTLRRARSDEENDDNVDELAHGTPMKQLAKKSARNTTIGHPYLGGSQRRDLPLDERKAARKLRMEDASDDEVIEVSSSSDEEEDLEHLAAALDALTLPASRLQEYRQLPFLLRNLCRGFRRRCERAGISTTPAIPPPTSVSVLYRYDLNDDAEASNDGEEHEYEEWAGNVLDWRCPLCRLHGAFNTRAMLEFHLRHDHSEVQIKWEQYTSGERQRLRIVLTIPDVKEAKQSDEEVEDSDVDQVDDATLEDTAVRGDSSPVETPFAAPPSVPPRVEVPDVNIPRAELLEHPSEALESPSPGRSSSPILIPKKFRAQSPTPSSSAQPTTQSRASAPAQRRPPAVSVSTRGSLPARYPTPPPQSDLLGPAAQYPYIPEDEYSCRPGGPKIYDLLNTLSLEPFGVLSWMIVDREEEIFELDDVRDEDKVMMALWNRWIMLNRPDFIFKGYLKGVLAFIDEYWRMIHKAAGWGALRAFLLMLLGNRFLTGAEVVKALKHYESHTGMDYWYKDPVPES